MDRKFYKGAERYNEIGRFSHNGYTRIGDMTKLGEIQDYMLGWRRIWN